MKCFFQSIQQFQENDLLKISINLYNNRLINLNTTQFNLKIKINKIDIPFILSEIPKINTRCKIDYSEFNLYDGRLNEFEYIKMKWREINRLENYQILMKKIIDFFLPYFNIKKAYYDDVGYYLFKFELIANTIGIFSKKELGLNFHIKNKNEYVTNEIKKNNLLYEKDEVIELRINDILFFYFTKEKENVFKDFN
jgi:hypothetical protein